MLLSQRSRMNISAGVFLTAGLLLSCIAGVSAPVPVQDEDSLQWSAEYRNPLSLYDPKTGPAVSCPDPAIIHEVREGEYKWYLFCTGDPLNSNDKDATGNLAGHLITEFTSKDLVNWTYIGDALKTLPAWVAPGVNLWAPAVEHFNNRYYLYYVAPNTAAPLTGYAIGVATAANPGGPWIDSGSPAVPPEPASCCGPDSRRWVIDPDIIADDSGQRWISYGSFYGGISIRKLSADGLTSDPASEVQIAVDNRYEGATLVKHDGYYYVMMSATNCCNGPLTGYSVFAARSDNPTGPYLDQNGISITDYSPGGSPVVAANGNRWVGPGGNVVFRDVSGQEYMLYHAVDQTAPYFSGYPGFTRRPVLMDALDWKDGWPVVRGGFGPSDTRRAAPAAQPWQENRYEPRFKRFDEPGKLLTQYSDEFNSKTLSRQWHFLHPNADNTYALTGSAYEVQTHGPDENGNPSLVSILAEPAPAGPYIVETKLSATIPPGPQCCFNFSQGALFIYGDDQNSIKADVFANFDTRQTEFGKQVGPVPASYPTYGNSVDGPPGESSTWLRVVVVPCKEDGTARYTIYTSGDGTSWYKGSTWTHQLGGSPQIGISAQNEAGVTIDFDYVHVYRLADE